MDSREACAKALEMLKHESLAATHPIETIQKVLVRSHALGVVSSGVEQNFSKGAWALDCRQSKASCEMEGVLFKVAIDLGNYDEEQLIQMAQECYVELFGMARKTQRDRIDKGVKRHAKTQSVDDDELCHVQKKPVTEIGFLRMRRAASASLVGANVNASVRNCGEAGDCPGWTPKHDEEVAYQQGQAVKRKTQALSEGLLLKSEITREIKQKCWDVKRDRVKSQRARERKQQARLMKSACGRAPTIHDFKSEGFQEVWVCPHLKQDVQDALGICVRTHGMRHVNDCPSAKVMVVTSPGSETANLTYLVIHVTAMLRGCYVVAPTVFLRNDGGGACLKYLPALSRKLVFYVSRPWRHKNNRLLRSIRDALANTAGNKWTLMWEQDKFLEVKKKSKYIQRAEVCALVTADDKRMAIWENEGIPDRHVLTTKMFLAKIRSVDFMKCCMGA